LLNERIVALVIGVAAMLLALCTKNFWYLPIGFFAMMFVETKLDFKKK